MKATIHKTDILLASLLAVTGCLLYLLEKPYSLCFVREHPKFFAGRSVALKGTLYGYSKKVIQLSGTGCEESDAWATVELSESFEATGKANEMLADIWKLRDRKQYIEAQVIVEGELEDHERSCFAPRFLITVRRLELLSPAVLRPMPFEVD